MKKWRKLASHAKSSTISRVYRCRCNFFVEILDDFHDCVSECVSFPKKINNPFWGLTVFFEEKWQFPLDVKQKHTFLPTEINEQKR